MDPSTGVRNARTERRSKDPGTLDDVSGDGGGLVGRWEYRAAGDRLRWDDDFCASVGLDPSAVRSLAGLLPLIHPLDRDALEADAAAVVGGDGRRALRFRLVPPGGDVREILAWADEIPHAEPGVVHGRLLDLTADVPERVALEADRDRLLGALADAAQKHELLSSSEERFRLVFENAPLGMAIFGLDRRILRVNRAFVELTGRPAAELEGADGAILLGRARTAEETSMGEALLHDLVTVRGAGIDAEREIVRPDGEVRSVSVRGVLQRSADGTPRDILTMFEDVSDRRRYELELERRALRDMLTDLPNRACVHDRLERDLARAARGRAPVGVLFCDIDRFKDVNDRHGHAVADEVLQTTATRLAKAVRGGDTVARYAGDEFLVSCPDTDDGELREIAERVVTMIREPMPTSVGTVHVSMSVGLATSRRGQDVEALVEQADEAMLEAKRRGRDRIEGYGEELERRRAHRVRIRAGLEEALRADGQLVVHYQPQIDLRTGAIVGVEALIRWRQPTGAVQSADGFVGVAADAGLLPDLTERALREACRQGAAWGAGEAGGTVAAVAVNVAASMCSDPDLPGLVAAVLGESGLNPAGLHLEVTEEALIDDLATAVGVVRDLRDRGVAVGIDDFGTGYASLAHLHELPLDFLKLDGSFVGSLRDDRRSALASSIVELAAKLGLIVVAECVEEEWQIDELRRFGVYAAQGHYWAPALPSDELASWVAAWRETLP